jgi:DNA-binding NtrC family response regulator
MMTGTILLVDDDLLVLRALKRDLEATGYRVLTSQSVASALEALEMEKIEVIISDYSMPGPNGLDLLAHTAREYPNIVRVMLTGHAGLEMAMEAINLGHVYHFLTKPWSKEELVTTADRCFRAYKEGVAATASTPGKHVEKKDSLKRRALAGELETQYPGISSVARQAGGVICIEDIDKQDFGEDLEALMRE